MRRLTPAELRQALERGIRSFDTLAVGEQIVESLALEVSERRLEEHATERYACPTCDDAGFFPGPCPACRSVARAEQAELDRVRSVTVVLPDPGVVVGHAGTRRLAVGADQESEEGE